MVNIVFVLLLYFCEIVLNHLSKRLQSDINWCASASGPQTAIYSELSREIDFKLNPVPNSSFYPLATH